MATSAAPGSAEMDRDVLLRLYQMTDGESWRRKKGWAENATDLGSWRGVTTNADGRVVKLKLQYLNLRGPLPPELGQLGAMEVLDLSSNSLSGTIPPKLGKLRALKRLKLRGRRFQSGGLSGKFITFFAYTPSILRNSTGVGCSSCCCVEPLCWLGGMARELLRIKVYRVLSGPRG
ncbi:unnamed protein product [Pylaiella littoralis]